MVKSALTGADADGVADPEVALAISYAPTAAQPGLRALWTLDTRLAAILRTTTEPALGQMRFTWWHEALGRGDVRGEPVLAAVAAAGIDARHLQRMVEGWEALLDPIDGPVLVAFGDGRGGGLFSAAAALLRCGEPVEAGGAGWALVDLARHASDARVSGPALAAARTRLAEAPTRWTRAGRPLGALVKLARRDLDGVEPQGSPRRALAGAMLALTGR